MPDLLLYADTERSPALRHEIPIAIMDSLMYAEVGGRAFIVTSNLEAGRIASVRPDAEIVNINDLGFSRVASQRHVARGGVHRADLPRRQQDRHS